MKHKGLIFILVAALALLALVACQGGVTTTPISAATSAAAGATTAGTATDTTSSDAATEATTASTPDVSAAEALAENGDIAVISVAAGAAETTTGESVAIALNGDSISAASPAVSINGNVATITAAGTYSLSGTLADGQILVDTEDEAVVQLVLDGVSISSATGAPIAVMNAEEVAIVLADGTTNTLVDAASYVFPNPEEDEPNAALFSNADMTISGNGALNVTANYNDAISSDDGLVIAGGTIVVSAVDDGLRGKDYLAIQGGDLTVTAGGDGLKADQEEDATLGYIAISGGVIQVTAQGDAIAAETDVIISAGQFTLVAGGGSGGQIAADASAKGIKGLVSVVIDGGTFAIDSADDALHSNGDITLNGGVFSIATGDDGIHADATLTINDGQIDVTTSYEGLESAVITINAGDIRVAASDDAINVAGGADSSGMMGGPGRGGPPGQQSGEAFTYTGTQYLYINGGTIVVYAAGGDGIDVNGAIQMTGGVVVVHGPTNDGNGSLDYDGGFNISGGLLVAAGSAGMAQAPDQSSTQNSLLVNFSSAQQAGTLVNIRNSAGQDVLTFAPATSYAALVYSSAALTTGETYTISLGGSDSGAAGDGLYSGGSYTPGTEYGSLTVSSVVTTLGQSRGFR